MKLSTIFEAPKQGWYIENSKNRIIAGPMLENEAKKKVKELGGDAKGYSITYISDYAARRMNEEVVIDNEKGYGQTPNNQEIDYFGFKVLMKPSIFLKLAPTLENGKSVSFFQNCIKNDTPIAAPTLYVKVPSAWKEKVSEEHTYVVGHEGRNRMMAILNEEGDTPIETHIILQSTSVEWRARHITPEIKRQLKSGICKEGTKQLITGPLWK